MCSMIFSDREYLKRSHCGSIGRTPLICCLTRSIVSDRPPIRPNILPAMCGQSQVKQKVPVHLIVGGKNSRIVDSPWLVRLEYLKSKCGVLLYFWMLPILKHRPINEQLIFVYFVLIYVASGKGFHCGGALITKNFVLTGRFIHPFRKKSFLIWLKF